MRKLYLLLFMVFITACSGIKDAQRALNSGSYDESIKIAVGKLQKDKIKKRNQEYIPILETAFEKAVLRDHERIAFLKAENNPAVIEEIFQIYSQLAERQEVIRPLLPLPQAHFDFKNYTQELITTKKQLVNFLYDEANALFERDTKGNYREAYRYYSEIEQLIPNFKDVRQQMKEAHYRGVDFVLVSIINETEQMIPLRLEEDLLNFKTYGLDDFWTIFDSQPVKETNYQYGLELVLRGIEITPEQVHEREISKEKQVIDGYEYAKDTNGNVLTDSAGNEIKVDKYITVHCDIYEFRQQKSCRIVANVNYIDFSKDRILDTFPIDSYFVFENSYGTVKGDERALDKDYIGFSVRRKLPFPSNEQMVFDAGMLLKARFKDIISKNHFR